MDAQFLSACTTVKIIRATKFAIQLDEHLVQNHALGKHHLSNFNKIIKKHDVNTGPLLLFGKTRKTKPAALLHGMFATVLSRFASCWTSIYDEDVRLALTRIPKEDTNFDARFAADLKEAHARQVVSELHAKRKSYLRYMAATAEVMREVFFRGRLWTFDTISHELSRSLDPFIDVQN